MDFASTTSRDSLLLDDEPGSSFVAQGGSAGLGSLTLNPFYSGTVEVAAFLMGLTNAATVGNLTVENFGGVNVVANGVTLIQLKNQTSNGFFGPSISMRSRANVLTFTVDENGDGTFSGSVIAGGYSALSGGVFGTQVSVIDAFGNVSARGLSSINYAGGTSDVGSAVASLMSSNYTRTLATLASNVPVLTTNETSILSFVAAAGAMAVGTTYKAEAWCTTTMSGEQITPRIRVGSTTLTGTVVASAIIVIGTGTRTGSPMKVEAMFTVVSAGTAGGGIGQAYATIQLVGTIAISGTSFGTASATINTAATNLVELTIQFSSAFGNCTFTNAIIQQA